MQSEQTTKRIDAARALGPVVLDSQPVQHPQFPEATIQEPPIPEGLGQLSPALETFVRFLDIDAALLAVAAQQSQKRRQKHLQLEPWISKSQQQQHDFLVR